jgi:hypothetical protein
MWAKYHRRQARTLVNLARLTRDPDTAVSWKRLAVRHAEMADRAEPQGRELCPWALWSWQDSAAVCVLGRPREDYITTTDGVNAGWCCDGLCQRRQRDRSPRTRALGKRSIGVGDGPDQTVGAILPRWLVIIGGGRGAPSGNTRVAEGVFLKPSGGHQLFRAALQTAWL